MRDKNKKKIPIEFYLINEKLDYIIGLLMVNIHREKSVGEKAFYLSKLGFTNKKIAEILGTTSNTIAVQLHKYRKKHP